MVQRARGLVWDHLPKSTMIYHNLRRAIVRWVLIYSGLCCVDTDVASAYTQSTSMQEILDFVQAKRRVIAMYAGYGWPSLFTRIRFFTAPYAALLPHVPREGTIIDLGCGYGIFSNLLALMSPQRRILGIDTDHAKMKYADRGMGNVEFHVGDIMKMDTPPADCLLVIHVLHHLSSFAAQDQFIHDCVSKLKSSGTLLICEVQPRPRWKLLLSYVADYLLYPGDGIYYRKPADLVRVLEQNGFKVKAESSHAGCPFSHMTYVARKPVPNPSLS